MRDGTENGVTLSPATPEGQAEANSKEDWVFGHRAERHWLGTELISDGVAVAKPGDGTISPLLLLSEMLAVLAASPAAAIVPQNHSVSSSSASPLLANARSVELGPGKPHTAPDPRACQVCHKLNASTSSNVREDTFTCEADSDCDHWVHKVFSK